MLAPAAASSARPLRASACYHGAARAEPLPLRRCLWPLQLPAPAVLREVRKGGVRAGTHAALLRDAGRGCGVHDVVGAVDGAPGEGEVAHVGERLKGVPRVGGGGAAGRLHLGLDAGCECSVRPGHVHPLLLRPAPARPEVQRARAEYLLQEERRHVGRVRGRGCPCRFSCGAPLLRSTPPCSPPSTFWPPGVAGTTGRAAHSIAKHRRTRRAPHYGRSRGASIVRPCGPRWVSRRRYDL